MGHALNATVVSRTREVLEAARVRVMEVVGVGPLCKWETGRALARALVLVRKTPTYSDYQSHQGPSQWLITATRARNAVCV